MVVAYIDSDRIDLAYSVFLPVKISKHFHVFAVTVTVSVYGLKCHQLMRRLLW